MNQREQGERGYIIPGGGSDKEGEGGRDAAGLIQRSRTRMDGFGGAVLGDKGVCVWVYLSVR